MGTIYRGFSTHEYIKNKTFKMTDLELVKIDLLNHIFTRRGERVMMPQYGTRIPDLAFEPLDDITISVLEEDLKSVFASDPRVSLVQLTTTPNYDTNSVTATATLLYIELNLTDSMDLNLIFEGN